MKLSRLIVWIVVACFSFASVTWAAVTNRWEFDDAGGYTLSDPRLISLDSSGTGVSELVLQITPQARGSVSEYLAGTNSYLGVGMQASLSPVAIDDTYSTVGTFTSRYLQTVPGNVLYGLRMLLSDANYISADAIPAHYVAFFGLDYDGVDSVSGSIAVEKSGSVAFSPEAIVGSGSLYCSAGTGSYQLQNNTLLNGATGVTFAVWVKANGQDIRSGIIGASGDNILGLSTDASRFLTLRINKNSLWSPFRLQVNQWNFVVGTWRGSDGLMQIYRNGVLVASGEGPRGVARQDRGMNIGYDGYSVNTFRGLVDNAIIMNRYMPESEVLELYDERFTDASPVQVQVRSGSSIAELESRDFTGPDGTTGSRYLGGELFDTPNFRPTDQIAQYRAFIGPHPSGEFAATLDSVTFLGKLGNIGDSTLGDFSRGATSTCDILTADSSKHALGLRIQPEGFPSAGSYESPVFDGEAERAVWSSLSWHAGNPLTGTERGLVGLFHLDGAWVDAALGDAADNSPTEVSVPEFTANAKLGTRAATFPAGADFASVSGFDFKLVSTVSMWLRTGNADSALLSFSDTEYVTISERQLIAHGFDSNPPEVYIGGIRSDGALPPGWQHVAVVWPTAVQASDLTIGSTSNLAFVGDVDELAIYNSRLSSFAVQSLYQRAHSLFSGLPSFRVRAADALDELAESNWSAAFSTPSAAQLPAVGRYFQYRIELTGGEGESPGAGIVQVQGDVDGAVDSWARANAGKYGEDSTIWYGDPITLIPQYAAASEAIVPEHENALSPGALVGLWHFDESAWSVGSAVTDSSSYNRDGTVQGGATVSSDAAVGVRCGEFDGIDSTVRLGAIPEFSTGEFTAMLWFKTSSQGHGPLLSTVGATVPFSIQINASGLTNYVPGVVSASVGDESVFSSRAGYNNDEWHHVTVTLSQGFLSLFINGERTASKYVGSGNIPSAASPSIGQLGSEPTFYDGAVDEVAIWSRRLSQLEVGARYGGGARVRDAGEFESDLIRFDTRKVWKSLIWSADGNYGQRVPVGADGLVGLWYLDEGSGVAVDGVGGRDGAAAGSLVYGEEGAFGTSVGFDGVGAAFTVNAHADLAPAAFTVECWVKPESVISRTLIDKSIAGSGYRLETDSEGVLTFWLDGVECKDWLPLLTGEWQHIAASYDGARMNLYVNGILRGQVDDATLSSASSADFQIGRPNGSGTKWKGLIDEVALYSKALPDVIVYDHYKAWAGVVEFQARAGDDIEAMDFIGPDGTSNTWFTTSGYPTSELLPVGTNYQFRFRMMTRDWRFSPKIFGVNVEASNYPQNNPYVEVADQAGAAFLGNLTQFDHEWNGGPDTSVRYAITGDVGEDSKWYYWGQNGWTAQVVTNQAQIGEDAFYFGQTSTRQTIAGNIDTFYSDIYNRTGGVFRFRAYLHSEGPEQVQVDWVEMANSEGRITVEFPNGEENGDDYLVASVTYDVEWSWTGKVSNALALEYSLNGNSKKASDWTQIAAGVPRGEGGTGSFPWTTPATVGGVRQLEYETNVFVRIRDMQDGSVVDVNDGPFTIARKMTVIAPNGGEKWYAGKTNQVKWLSTYSMGGGVGLFYAQDATNFSRTLEVFYPNIDGVTNTYNWVIPNGEPSVLSTNAKIKVESPNANLDFTRDVSDAPFTIAGAAFTAPAAGQRVKQGDPFTLEWVSVEAGNNIAIDISLDNGQTFTNLFASVSNAPGQNALAWDVEVQGADEAYLRIRSLDDPNVVALSKKFIVASIDILKPDGLEVWLRGTTNEVSWIAGGAGSTVSLYFRTRPDGEWNLIDSGVPASGPYNWQVSDLVTTRARLMVRSDIDTNLFAISEGDFNIAGVRVSYPNTRNDTVEKLVQTFITHDAAPQTWTGAKIEITYDQGVTYELANPDQPVYSLGAPLFFTPRYPSRQCKVRVTALSTPGYTNIFDESDEYFTTAGIVVEEPVAGALYNIGQQGNITWISAGAASSAEIWYSDDDTNNFVLITPQGVVNNQIYPGRNPYIWSIPRTIVPSDNARVMVKSATYSHMSPQFVLRGLRFTDPVMGNVWPVGSDQVIRWRFAGIDSSCQGTVSLSLDGGQTFVGNLSTNHPITGLPFLEWTVPADIRPTTNAVLKLRVDSSDVANDVGLSALSDPFTLKGLRVEQPNGGLWLLEQTNIIQWTAAGVGDTFSIHYSADGGETLDPTAIVTDLKLGNGTHTYTWGVEKDREPTTNAVIRVISSGGTGNSVPFTLGGVRVDRPMQYDIWAVGDLNMVKWIGIGTDGSYSLTLQYLDGQNPDFPIAVGVQNNQYLWNVSPTTLPPGLDEVSNVVMRITDSSGIRGFSEPFKLVKSARIEILEPKADVYWKVGQERQVKWIKGGGALLPDDFKVFYLYGDNFSLIDEIDTPVTFDADNNTFSVPWSIPDELGPAKIFVTNTVRTTVFEESPIFTIAPNITVIYPNGDPEEDPVYAQAVANLSWTTWGTAEQVDLFYSLDKQNWIPIVQGLDNNSTRPPSAPAFTIYDWTVPDLDVSTVWFRVQDSAYPQSFGEGLTPGPFDDSDHSFGFNYFIVKWDVGYIDEESGERLPLDQLSVSDSSGWSENGLSNIDPEGNFQYIERKYPYGRFDTIWYRPYFNDTVDFKWLCSSNQTRQITMISSATEQPVAVLADFQYDVVDDNLKVHAWIERSGRLLTNAEEARVKLYDSAGALADAKSSTVPLENGVFRLDWPLITEMDAFSSGESYIATVEIDYNGVTYSAAVSYTLNLPADQAALQAVLEEMERQTATMTNEFGEVKAQVQSFRDEAVPMLSTLTNRAEQTLATLTNMQDSIVAAVEEVITPAVSAISNELSTVILPAVTNMEYMVSNVYDNTSADQARILTRNPTVELFTTNRFLYKSTPGYSANEVRFTVDGQLVNEAMTELSSGIYGADVHVDWGLGEYTVFCTDPGASDSMILTVVLSVDSGASSVSALESQLGAISNQVANLVNVFGGDSGGSQLSSQFDQLNQAISGLQQSVAAGGAASPEVLQQLSSIGAALGSSAGDGLIGRVSSLDSNMGTIGQDVKDAKNFAISAKNEAAGAKKAVTDLQGQIESGAGTEQVQAGLEQIRGQLQSASASIENIPQAIGLGALENAVNEVALKLRDLVELEGFTGTEGLLPPSVTEEEGAEGPDSESIQSLNNNIRAVQSSLDYMKLLLDDSINQPVVEEDWFGVAE